MEYNLKRRTANGKKPSPELVRAAGGDELVASLLLSRGISDEEGAKHFLAPSARDFHDPYAFRDMETAVHLLRSAAASGRAIRIHGDYDADGICASAILYRTLQDIGAQDVEVLLPSRSGTGYGLSEEALQRIPAGALLVTVDCGVSNAPEVEAAKKRGMDVIVTDHHLCPRDLPKADALMNPHLEGETYPCADLCGAGVAFKISQALLEGTDRDRYLDLAALATVADVVPLRGENRAIVALGLRQMKVHPSDGLAALLEEMNPKADEITTELLAFRIVPPLNAAGRLASPQLAFDLLSTRNEGKRALLAATICKLNETRKERQQAVIDAAASAAHDMNDPVLVLGANDWDQGVLGPAAARIAELQGRPAVLLAPQPGKPGSWTGSSRSFGSFNVHDALAACSHLLTKFGGHAAAAGLTLDEADIPALRACLTEYAGAHSAELQPAAEAAYDFEFKLPLPADLPERLAVLEPFGAGNPEPVLLLREQNLARRRPIGGGVHTALQLGSAGDALRAILFRTAPDELPDTADVLGTLRRSTYTGAPEMTIRLISAPETDTCFFARVLPQLAAGGASLPASLYFRDKVRLGLVYSALVRGANVPGSAAQTYAQILRLIPDLTREEAAFAFAVFRDLQLIALGPDDKIVLNAAAQSGPKRQLVQSSVYRAMEARVQDPS